MTVASSVVLVGRDAEQAQLDTWLAARSAQVPGTPPALFVTGEAGVGKTALIEAALVGRRDVCWVSAVPWHPAPFGVLSQLTPDAVHDPQAVRASLTATGRPSVLVLDDLQWADNDSLSLLAPLIDALNSDPVAVITAYRADELPRGHLLRRTRAQLRHRRQFVEIALDPLPASVLPELIAATVGARPSPALVSMVAEKTEGVPFLVTGWLTALSSAGWLIADADQVDLVANDAALSLPDSIRDAVLLQAAALSPAARAALDVAAVIGTSFTIDAVVAVLAAGWPDELDHSGLIRAGTGRVRHFRHALVQEAIYSDLPWSRRRELHIACTEPPGLAPATVARHLLAAGELARARPALLTAADEHYQAHAYRDAAQLLATALESWPTGSDEESRLTAVDALARCAELSGDHTAAVRSLRELIDRRPAPDTERRLAVQHELLGHWPLALSAREAAAIAFTACGEAGEAATERLAVATHLRSAASFQAALETLSHAEVDARTAQRDDLVCRIGGLRGNILARQGDAARGVALVQASLDKALELGLTAAAAEIYQRLADALEHGGDYRSATQVYDTAFEFCQAHQQDAAGQLCQACATVVLFHRGQWERALALCADVRARPSVGPHAAAVAHGIMGLIQSLRRRYPARTLLLESRMTAIRIDLVGMELVSTWGMALLDEATAGRERAAASYRQVIARCQQTEERHYCVPILQYAAAFFAADPMARGVSSELGAISALLAEAVEISGQPEARAGLAYVIAEIALAADGPVVGAERLHNAADQLDGLDLPVVETLVRHRLGVALAAAGDQAAARDVLQTAYRTAQRLKARFLMDRIVADLSPLTTAQVARTHSLLSPREVEILRLVGEGLTSREVGQRLFLSARTVDMHVRNGMTKLDCRTRAEAVRRLAASE